MKGKVLSFGELLLRICPDTDGQWTDDNSLPIYIGGAECNVATALALWEVPSSYFTAIPDNYFSEQIVQSLRKRNIQTDKIRYEGDRVGLYYLPKGKDLKNAGVIYDRAGSSFTGLKPGVINWDEVFAGVYWFHFSAICPAISQQVADVCEEALTAASARGVKISLDLNYRAKLWKYGKTPVEVMPVLAKYCNVIMGNIWAANTMLGIPVHTELVEGEERSKLEVHSRITSEAILKQFPACSAVANTFRFENQGSIKYFTTLYDGDLHVSKQYNSEKIKDIVGSGDCFMAGLIYGYYHDHAVQNIVEFATAAAFDKLFIENDSTSSTVEEINKRRTDGF
jgi:2-dehydro-3-deoxygluconokinase